MQASLPRVSEYQKRFESNPRRMQEIRLRPLADKVYRSVFGNSIDISRYGTDYALDKEFAIDVVLVLDNGLILNGQEKFLSSDYAKFHSITVEYEQNQFTGERGDWFKLACQFYFCGYANKDETEFVPYVLANWTSVVLATSANKIEWKNNANRDGKARASFRYCDMYKLPPDCIIAKSWKP